MARARVDNSLERAVKSLLSPGPMILDNLHIYRRSAQQSTDLYELIIGRQPPSGFTITNNSIVEAQLSLSDDPVLGNSMPRGSCVCIIGDTTARDPVRELVNQGDFLRRCGHSLTERWKMGDRNDTVNESEEKGREATPARGTEAYQSEH